MELNLTLPECAAVIVALEEIEDKYKAVEKMGEIPEAFNGLMRAMGAPDNFLSNTRNEILEEGRGHVKAIRTAKAKMVLYSEALEEAVDKALKAALMAEAEKASQGEA